MPIYEFRCLKCNDCFEFLLRNQEEQIELRCPKCKSEELERVISVSCHSVGDASPKGESAQSANPKLSERNLYDLRYPWTQPIGLYQQIYITP